MNIKIIKNTDTVARTYAGMQIASAGQYQIQDQEIGRWANDSALLADIGSGKAVVNNGTSDITDVALAINYLKDIQLVDPTGLPIVYTPTYSNKTLPDGKKLYARNTGKQFSVSAGSNVLTYTATYAHAKLVGVEVINAEALDYVDLKVRDTASGTYSGYPNVVLNQFAYTHNIPKDYYIRLSRFDADLYVNMVIEITYNSVSAKTIGINFIMDEVKT